MEGSGRGAVGRPSGGRSAGVDESAGDEQDEPSSSSSSSSSVMTVLEETSDTQQSQQTNLEDDLEQFRQRWRQEVSQQQRPDPTPASAAAVQQAHPTDSAAKLDKAVELYMAGMQLEQRGLLYEAIQKYRRAVQTDSSVEEVVRRLLLNRHQQQQQRDAATPTHAPPDDSGDASSLPEDGRGAGEDTAEDALYRLQQLTLQDGRCCQPSTPQTAVHISCLPAEVMQLIACWIVSSEVDVRSLDLLALVCRGFYRIARDNAIWKRICRRVLGPGCVEPGVPAVWRELYLSRPHLHFCGCYISRASYIRAGEMNGYQDQNYRPWHMVHYYRLLRLFPEGQLMMLTSADEPAVSVGQLLHRPPRPAPVVTGHYRLKGDRVVAVLSVPREAGRRMKSGRVRLRRGDMLQYDPGQQMLHIELDVMPFRLVWQSYKVVTLYSNGKEATHTISLNDQYPAMVFSRVRSYTAVSEAPLR